MWKNVNFYGHQCKSAVEGDGEYHSLVAIVSKTVAREFRAEIVDNNKRRFNMSGA